MINVGVVGAGAAGAAASYALARRGARVTLYDQFDFCSDRGSSHGATRLFRTAYFEHPDYVPILKQARNLWRDLERAANEDLYFETGVLEAGPADGPLAKGLETALAAHELAVEKLSVSEAMKRFPHFKLPDDYEVFFELEAGFVFAEKSVAAMLNLAGAAGARLRPQTKVQAWKAIAGGATVQTLNGVQHHDFIVLAPGVWSDALLSIDGLRIAPTPKTLFWRQPPDDEFAAGGAFPPFAIETPAARLFYGFPAIDADGVKAAEHTGGAPIATPEDESPAPSPGEEEALEAFLATHIPSLAGRDGKFKRCRYEMSPDSDFIVDRHPSSERVVVAAGLSGHGFKFAPALGEAIADYVFDGEFPREWRFLSMTRLT